MCRFFYFILIDLIQFNKNIILASSSPRRKALLHQAGITFEVLESNIEETWNNNLSAEENVQWLSYQKADAVAKRVSSGIVIGADTVVSLRGKIFGKPKDNVDAKRMLNELSGETHIVFTGYTIIEVPNKKTITSHESTQVTFRKLTDEEIQYYISTGSPFDKAGGYGIQDDFGAIFINQIQGDFYNVVGLPLSKVYESLKQFSIVPSTLIVQ